MDNFSFNFDYNFSYLNLVKLHQEWGITTAEIISSYENVRSRARQPGDIPLRKNYFIITGYSSKKRILLIFLHADYEITFMEVKVADEDEIELYYCSNTSL